MKVIKQTIKRVFAVGAGVIMLGATAMGAMAADLSNYPDMFVKDGVFDGYLVVGENAASVDNLAMTDIAASMKYMESSSTSSVSVEGDAWQVGTSADWLEVNESIGPSGQSGIVDYIGEDELSALADGEFTNSKGTFKYEQKLHFDSHGARAMWVENEDDQLDLFWKISGDDQLALYELDFVTDAESDIDYSDSYSLKDFADKEWNFLGTTWTMTKAVYDTTDGVQLTFMGGASQGTVMEGESQTYSFEGNDYDVSVSYVDATNAVLIVNGESTGKLEDGETFVLADGTTVGVSDILYQNYAGGVHQASFFIGANKLYLADTNISDTAYDSAEIKVNEETIDGATVLIKGTIVTDSTAALAADGNLKLDYIHVNMTAQDDMYLAAGDKLSESAELEEAALLFTQNWDFEFHGVNSDVEMSTIGLQKSGDDKYELAFTSADGSDVVLPLLFASANDVLQLGEKSGDNLAIQPTTNISDDDYFVLATKNTSVATNSDAEVTVLQYISSKNSEDDVQTVKFKNVNTGESIERTFSDACIFDLSLNGKTHTFSNATGDVCTADNWDIKLTSTDYVNTLSVEAANSTAMNIRDRSGALITVYSVGNGSIATPDPSSTLTSMAFKVTYPDTDKLDDYTPAAETILLYNLTEMDTAEVTANAVTNPVFNIADPDDNDVTWGFSATGVKVKKTAASSSPVELELTSPDRSAEILAYITSGATSSVTSVDGTLTAVEGIVSATKLDSEVSDVTAQNLIVVGGPCVNSVAAELLGNPADCTEGFTPGKARVKLVANGDNMAMLVAGYSGADTRLAGKVIAHREAELTGMEVEVEGTTYSDATIGAPTMMVEEVVEEVVEVVAEEEVVATTE